MFDSLNYWAILVSGALYWILGGVWYAAIFSKPYQAGLNFSEAEKAQVEKAFPKALAAHFGGGLVTAFVLAMLTHAFGANGFVAGAACAFWPWLGFVFTVQTNHLMFEKRPASLFTIDSGFYLVAFLVMGGILGVWK